MAQQKLHIAKNLTLPLEAKAKTLEKQRERNRKWRAVNREELREYYRRYRAEHSELKAYHAKYYQTVEKAQRIARPKTDTQRATARAYREAHRDRRIQQRREWGKRNPERQRKLWRLARQRNAAKKRTRDAQYRQRNPESWKQSIAKAKARKPEHYRQLQLKTALARRSRKKAAPVEPVSIRRIIDRDNSICHLCRLSVRESERSLDHLIPVVRGGAFAEWNLAVAHSGCNKRRGTRQILREETKDCAVAYTQGLCVSKMNDY